MKDLENIIYRVVFFPGMANSKVACSDCGGTFGVAFEPVAGRPLYCSDCFDRNFKFKSNDYLNEFIAFLGKKLGFYEPSKLGSNVEVAREGFLYQILLKEKGVKTPRFACTMELIPISEPRATAKFIIIFSVKGSKVQNIQEYIGEFQRSHGAETEIPLTPLRKF